MRLLLRIFSAIFICFAVNFVAFAQDSYPNRTVNFVVPYPAGNAADIVARLVAQRLATDLGQPFVVINRPGAAGTIGTAAVARAAADGYTLLVTSPSNITIAPWLSRTLDYDPKSDFAAVAGIGRGPFALLANKDVPVSTTADLIDYIRKRPGAVNYGSFGPGSLSHLAMEFLRQSVNIEMQHIPYQGSGPAQTDLVGGRIQILFDSLTAATARLAAGDAKVLALSTKKRHPMAPEIPTVAESGIAELASYDVAGWVGILAPKGTPADIVATLGERVLRISDAIGPNIADYGMERFALGPNAFDAYLHEEIAKWRKTIEHAKIDLRN
jgi:tripartite-type tricarboxylate transporter receptor subunit TctC